MPTKNETHHGTWGWLALGAAVVAFDIYNEESLSHAFSRYPTVVKLGTLAVTTAHLLDLIPEQYDPFDIAIKYAGARHWASKCIAERIMAEDRFDVFPD